MAERRMISRKIIDTDAFVDMPITARLLYYELNWRADDDGFVSSPKKILRMAGCSEDDFRILIAKQFLIPFQSGVVLIRDWRIHNYIAKDRYKETIYTDEKNQVLVSENGMYTRCIQIVDECETQVRLGKDRLGEDRVGDAAANKSPHITFKKPTVDEILQYCGERNNLVDPVRFFDFYESKGWMIGKTKMKDWKAAVRTWEKGGSVKPYSGPVKTAGGTFKI